ncbi:CinA family protein [Glutamicibacter sp. JC586]|uniref:CinA family protein n=1 Tax=Glutamicibacter sp. JC586 TaxID=2590552 RepID=UPI00190F2BB9|nr:CinA family protein [Glutamicibacter sp. JC586]
MLKPQAPAVIAAASERGVQLATAESLTAGMIAARLAEVSGASAVLRGGVVSYSSDVKRELLNVDENLLQSNGSVDPEVARQMAVGALKACGADLAISATGVAGPEPHDGKSVGTVFIGWAYGAQSGSQEHHFVGDRSQIREQSTQAALGQIAAILNKASSQ